MSIKDEIGRKVIGDTHTHVDFPYQCKRCGVWLHLDDRHRWNHECVPTEKNFFTRKNRRSNTMPPESITPPTPGWMRARSREQIKETYAKGYKHGQANKGLFQQLKRVWKTLWP